MKDYESKKEDKKAVHRSLEKHEEKKHKMAKKFRNMSDYASDKLVRSTMDANYIRNRKHYA